MGASLAPRHGTLWHTHSRTHSYTNTTQNKTENSSQGPFLLVTLAMTQPSEPWPPADNMSAAWLLEHYLGVATVIPDRFHAHRLH